MSSELIKINTSTYSRKLDEILENRTEVYLKAKLTKRLTYGEYAGEPKNGVELVLGDTVKILSLDNVEVFEQPISPSLTDDQQVVLDYLKKMCPPELGVSAMVTTYCLVDDNINDNWQEYSDEIPEHIEALQKLSVAEENQVLAAFAEWVCKSSE